MHGVHVYDCNVFAGGSGELDKERVHESEIREGTDHPPHSALTKMGADVFFPLKQDDRDKKSHLYKEYL
jgi:hypothetical protein